MKVQVLIDNALYMSLYDREYQAIPGNMQEAALNTFINMLDENRHNVPYHEDVQTVSFAELSNTDFTKILQVEYILGGVKYPLEECSLSSFNRLSCVIGLKAPPRYFYFDNLTQTIQVYPEPTNGEKFIIHGYKAMEAVNLTDEIPSNMPVFMRSYMEFALAKRLCTMYERQWSNDKEAELERLELLLDNNSDIDLTAPVDVVMSANTNGKGSFPWFYYLSGGGARP